MSQVGKVSSARIGRFNDHVVVVTGGASGIGKNISESFASENATVVICDVDEEQGATAKSAISKEGLSCDFIPIDLRKKGAARGMVREIIGKWGRIDCLVNNARSGNRTTFWEEDEDSWDLGMSVTLKAAFFASQAAIPEMAKIGGGSIVNIGSTAGFSVNLESPVYHAAKAGIAQLTRYMAVYAAEASTRVNCVAPGFIVKEEDAERYHRDDNKWFREIVESTHPVGRSGHSDDVAKAVVFLCSEDAAFITGEMLVVDGGMSFQEPRALLYKLSQ